MSNLLKMEEILKRIREDLIKLRDSRYYLGEQMGVHKFYNILKSIFEENLTPLQKQKVFEFLDLQRELYDKDLRLKQFKWQEKTPEHHPDFYLGYKKGNEDGQHSYVDQECMKQYEKLIK